MKTKEINNYLASDSGKRNANRFLLALKETRFICSVKRVSSSGMSRQISFCEMNFSGGSCRLFQFNYFIECLGFRYNSNYDCITVSGCGMDMIFNTLYTVCEILKDAGFAVPENFSSLCGRYSLI